VIGGLQENADKQIAAARQAAELAKKKADEEVEDAAHDRSLDCRSRQQWPPAVNRRLPPTLNW
jgi:hypothetical protein